MESDVLIIGAGSAGVSAALTLGRCLRRVLVADGGPPRNAASPSPFTSATATPIG
jgi:thioredoxin reductase